MAELDGPEQPQPEVSFSPQIAAGAVLTALPASVAHDFTANLAPGPWRNRCAEYLLASHLCGDDRVALWLMIHGSSTTEQVRHLTDTDEMPVDLLLELTLMAYFRADQAHLDRRGSRATDVDSVVNTVARACTYLYGVIDSFEVAGHHGTEAS